MTEQPGEQETKRLDEIDTQWSLLRLSHEDSFADSESARGAMVLRYSSAIRSYIGALVRDEPDADEVAQDVLVRLLKGDFKAATPERGRFRDLLKVSVRNMVRTHWDRKRRRSGAALDAEQLAETDAESSAAIDPWLDSWRDALLSSAWQSIEAYQTGTSGSIAYTVLRMRSDYPEDDSRRLAERVSEAVGREIQSAAVRQQLRRARLRFAQYLLEELHRGLENPTPTRVEDELIALGLMAYVGDFLPDDWRETGVLSEG